MVSVIWSYHLFFKASTDGPVIGARCRGAWLIKLGNGTHEEPVKILTDV